MVSPRTGSVVGGPIDARSGATFRRTGPAQLASRATRPSSSATCMTWRGRLTPSTPVQRSPRRKSATNRRSSTVPSTISMSSVPDGRPASCSLRSYWSDQNHGIGRNASVRAGIVGRRPGQLGEQTTRGMLAHLDRVLPLLDAHDLVETGVGPAGDVTRRDDAGRCQAGLVAAHAVVEGQPRPLEPAGVRARHRRRRPRPRPAPRCRRRAPGPSCRRRRSSPLTPTPRRTSTPSSRCSWVTKSPMRPGSTRPRGTSAASIIVTSSPRPRQVAATSAPMKPAPMTATRGATRRRARRGSRGSPTWCATRAHR